jgi:phasin family protein
MELVSFKITPIATHKFFRCLTPLTPGENTMSTTEQFSAAARNQLESQLSLTTALTDKMIDSMEKMMGLNLQAAKATMEASVANAHKLLSAKDPQEFFSLSAAQAQPQAEMVMTYGRHLASIATSTQAELSKTAESQLSDNSRKLASMFDEVSKHAPAGSENAVAMMKTAFDNASAGYEQITKSTKMAVEAMETNMSAASKAGSRNKK